MFPIFVTYGTNVRDPIEPMPGIAQISVDNLKDEVDEIVSLGIKSVLLFGIPESKDSRGTGSYALDGIVQNAVREIKDAQPDLIVATDVCMCEYTDHGHCGILLPDGEVDNDTTLPLLAETAVSHVEAGADIVAPSAMMDGQVAAIRAALDSADHTNTTLMAYAAKYSSAFYGPFRIAAESAPQQGDRRSYQMDPATDAGQALREVELDLAEGADMVMVKPALAYLDVIRTVHDHFPGVPLAAYNVSGEFSMVKAAAANGWIDERAVVLESLTAMHRAGANMILTYWAKDVAGWL